MEKTLYPILLCPLIIEKERTIFYTIEKEVEITLPAIVAKRFVVFCDGTHSLDSLIDYFSNRWSKKSLEELFQALIVNKVLLDARNLGGWISNFIKNPTAWKPELSKQEEINLICDQQLQKTTNKPTFTRKVQSTDWTIKLSQRRSRRHFGTRIISEKSLIRLLWSGYGALNSILAEKDSENVYRRTVPSAGALFPITMNLCLLRDVGTINKGIYQISYTNPNEVELTLLHRRIEEVKGCMVDTGMLQNAVGIIIINGCLSRSAIKYGNRSILYTILEAGHSAQNIHLFAKEEKIVTVEVGGFLEERLANQLNLKKDICPLTTIVLGSFFTKKEITTKSRVKKKIYIHDIVRRVEIVPRAISNYELPFSMVFVESLTPSTGNIWWSCGRSKNKTEAEAKAYAEATEWFACGHVINDNLIEGKYDEFGETAIDPRIIIKYLPDQYGKIQPFDRKTIYEWFWVDDFFTGKKQLILADLIFFPYFPKYGKRYAFSNSSGVAAHTTKELAIEHAVLENIEREAFMITWLNSLKRSWIPKETLPNNLKRRVVCLERLGFRVRIVNITYDFTPVIMIIVAKYAPPFLSCSAASGYDILQILDRAMMEIEASVYSYIKVGSSKIILSPDEVIRTMDHGAFYENNQRIKKAEFLFGADKQKTNLSNIEKQSAIFSNHDLYNAIQKSGLTILVADLTEQVELKSLPYKVVRTIIPGFVPMNFGHGLEPAGLDRIRNIPVSCGLKNKPLTIKKLNRFPHPFT